MLVAKDLRKTYQLKKGREIHALDGVSLTLPDRGMVFILGKSGSGKSTLLNILGGLDSPDSGEVEAFGQSTRQFKMADYNSYRNKYIGFVFQDYNVLNSLTVRENVTLALQLQGAKGEDIASRVDEILSRTGLLEMADRKPSQLSGGQKQRIAVARALVKNPRIILADEPTGALDTESSRKIFNLLRELSKTALVVCVTHDALSAERYADRIIRIHEGKITSDVTRIPEDELEPISASGNLKRVGKGLLKVNDVSSLSQDDLEALGKTVGACDKPAYISYGDSVIVPPTIMGSSTESQDVLEGFRYTTDEDIQRFMDSPTEYKTFSARLPFIFKLKMGATSLLHGAVRLAFTIIISLLAFTVLGVATSLTLYSGADTFAETSSLYTPATVSFRGKGTFTDFKGSHQPKNMLAKDDIDNISDAFHGDVISVFSGSYTSLSKDLADTAIISNDSQYNSFKNVRFRLAAFPEGYTVQDVKDGFGFDVTGELPESKYDAMLTDFDVSMLIQSGGARTYRVEGGAVVEDETLDASQIGSDGSGLIGKQIYLNSHADKDAVNASSENLGLYTVTGILDTGFDLTESENAYASSNTMTSEFTRERLELDYLEYGPVKRVFLSPEHILDTDIVTQLATLPTEGTIEYDNPILYAIVPAGDYSGLYDAFSFTRRTFSGTRSDHVSVDHWKSYILESVITDGFLTDSFQKNISNISNMCLWLAIAMGVVSVLITMNYIFTSVEFKRQDIGILKGLGARSVDVFYIFLFEAIIIGLVNFGLSLALTAILTGVVNSFLRAALGTPLSLIGFDWPQVLILLVVSLLVAVISAIIPSYKIASMKPVKAMRRDE